MPAADDVDPSLLESLEDSTSSSDIPKSKMDKVRAAYFGLSEIRLPKSMSCDHCTWHNHILFIHAEGFVL